MFSILIPSYNNLPYLKLCISSIKKNSKFNHEIIVHSNVGSDGTLKYLVENNIKHTYSDVNIGLCSSLNLAAKVSSLKYLLYTHDDMYLCPNWDEILINEVNMFDNDLFYLSGTMIEPKKGAHINFNCGSTIDDFDENKLLNNYKDLKFYDHQGSHFAPHLVSKRVWETVSGFSEEFNPGIGSDPDFNMKLWVEGVRVFKGINMFRTYHFSSITTRKKTDLIQNKGDQIFLKKWGITTKFFKKYCLKSRTKFDGPLSDPKKTLFYYFELFLCKIRFVKSYFKNIS